ncbi:MAG: DUF4190 domain-containing protein [Pyrinomonadaceae bacterium]
MKKCPTCERTFEDSMRFCQSDGTPLVDDAPPLDPYKTMVARPEDIAAGISASLGAAEPQSTKDEGEVLQLPVEADPLKTMYASEDEIRKEMEAQDKKDEQVMDIPPLAPEPPKFSEPSLSPPSFGSPPPPSPFGQTAPPIPSPFDNPKPSTYEPPAPNFPEFKDPEPVVSTAASNPFESQSPATPDWTPPQAIEADHKQENMQNPSFTPSPAVSGQNKTLSIVSLVLGIISIVLCCGFLTGVPALIVGIMARGKANSNPSEYGGAGLALGGIITGVIGTLLGLAWAIFYLFFGGMAMIQGMSS